jgi:type IV secretory pathway VirB10-like protein
MANLDGNYPMGRDPRPLPSGDAPHVGSSGDLRPQVSNPAAGGLWLVIGGAVLAGAIVFLWLASHRTQTPRDLGAAISPSAAGAQVASPPPAPPDLLAVEAAARGAGQIAPPPIPVASAPAPVIAAPIPAPAPAEGGARASAPTLVVDLADPSVDVGPAPTASGAASNTSPAGGGAAAGPAAHPGAGAPGGLSGDEQFAARVAVGQPDHASATVLHNRSEVVAQGAMIPAVLETALDSDLPGFARAVVTRDVRSFDGSAVLIPRGTRVVGEYHSAATQAQTRAFVIWTRLLRPDGVSIQIGSPATDPLGRAGLNGSVDNHYLQEFGGAILLTVLNAGATALAGAPNTEVVIGSSVAGAGAAPVSSAFTPQQISPTIKVPQGTPIRIFVARDLDFSPVQGRAP